MTTTSPVRLRPWNRFHLRLTALYAVAVFGVLTPMAALFYHLGVEQELGGLQRRLLTTATAVSAGLVLDDVLALHDESQRGGPAFLRVNKRLAAVSATDPEIRNLYILLRTSQPGELRFALDHDRDRPADSAEIGDLYDASRFPKMIAALEKPMVEDEVTVDEWGPSLAGWAPIRDASGASIGVLGIDVLGARIDATRRRILLICGGVGLLALLLLAIAAVAVGRNVQEPLGRMIQTTAAIAGGDLNARLRLQRSDEFGLVGSRFDAMAAGLEEREFIRDTFGRYVSEEVARSLLADRSTMRLGGEVRDVTIIFCDLRGYSTISEQLEPKEVVDLLNRYLGAMNDVIDAHGGVVIEFLGDAILAVFGAPHDVPNHASAALRCAEAMGAQLATLNDTWRAEGLAVRWEQVGLDSLRQRVGIHCGPVVAGNLGSRKRAKYAVIGDAVNVAARLEQLNKEVGVDSVTALLFSDAVHEAIDPDLRARAVRRGEFTVKGRQQPVGAWTLAPLTVPPIL